MNDIFHILQHSVNNDERQGAQRALRQAQEQSPQEFLTYVMSVALPPTDNQDVKGAFFAATVMLEFVENLWKLVPENGKSAALATLLKFITERPLSSAPLTRKLCSVFALMLKLQLPRKQPKGPDGSAAAPEILQRVIHGLTVAANNNADVRVQALMALHLLLKELLSKRIGRVFETACVITAPSLVEWLNATALGDQQRPLFVLCLKIALRVFGHGIFSAEALNSMLHHAFRLAGEASNLASSTIRALEYCCKILVAAMDNFSSRLSELGVGFFSNNDPNVSSMFQFAFLAMQAWYQTRHQTHNMMTLDNSATPFTDKLACRCMKLLSQLTTREDGDAFVSHTLSHLAQSSTCESIMRLLIKNYLADDVQQLTSLWQEDPEKYVTELDVIDDETDPVSCAEQLFLSLTSSTACSATCVAISWSVVNELLASNSDADVTAGLHAIGLGYSTLAGYDHAQYLQFLNEKLLPLIVNASNGSQVSLLVVRRVVWVIGMWCESVEQMVQRQQVHQVLSLLLQPTNDPVVLLTTLRSVEHFVSDNNFTTAELDGLGRAVDPTSNVMFPVYVSQILACLRHVIPRLRSASMIKEVVGLCLVLTEKKALTEGGELMMFVLQPAVEHFTALADKLQTATGQHDSEDSDDGSTELATFGLILETVSSAVKIASSSSSIWQYLSLVQFCTNPSHIVATWTQDYAWELLLRMAQSTASCDQGVAGHVQQALEWSHRHLDRDFEGLHTVVRCIAALMLLLGSGGIVDSRTVESVILPHLKANLFTAEGHVFQAYAGLASVLIALCPTVIIPRLFSDMLQYHFSVGDQQIQEDERLPSIATLASQMVLQNVVPFEGFITANDRVMIACPPGSCSQSLSEKWSLVLDVTPNQYASSTITRAAVKLVENQFIVSEEDVAMISAAVQSLQAAESDPVAPGQFSPTGGCYHHHTDTADQTSGNDPFVREGSVDSTHVEADGADNDGLERRDALELLLEWLNDGDVPTSTAHAQRVSTLFGIA